MQELEKGLMAVVHLKHMRHHSIAISGAASSRPGTQVMLQTGNPVCQTRTGIALTAGPAPAKHKCRYTVSAIQETYGKYRSIVKQRPAIF